MEKNITSKLNSSKQIKLGAFMSYIAIVLNVAIGFLYIPWMIKQIGQSDYGLYTLAISLISFFAIDFGLGEAVARFLSKYNYENDKEKRRSFLGLTFKIYMIIDILIFVTFLILFVSVEHIYTELSPKELSKFQIVFLIAAVYSIISFPFTPLNGVLISHERFAFYKFVEIFNKLFTVILIVIVLYLGYNLYALVIVNAIIGTLSIVLKLGYIFKNGLMEINFKSKDRLLLKEIFNFSSWTTIIGVSQRFVINITPTVLAAFSGAVQITLFSIAMVIEGYIWTFANALNGLFLPKVTRISMENDDSTEIENLMIRVGRIQLVIVGLLIVGFLTMGKEFMLLWMGENYVDVYYVTLLLIAPCIITLTQQIGNTALVAKNEIKYRAYCYLIVAIISITVSLSLSPLYGAIGSGIAIFLGNFVGLVIGLNIIFGKILKINIVRFLKECHVKFLIPLFLSISTGFLIQYLFPVTSLFFFMLKACIFAIFYALFMWVLGLNEYEKNLIVKMFKKIRKI